LNTTAAGGAPALIERSVRLPANVVYREFVQETIVLNLESGLYHSLNSTGGNMLRALESAGTIAAAAKALAEEYPGVGVDRLRQDLTGFCNGLAERGLIEIGD
jgi:hypothetical protein